MRRDSFWLKLPFITKIIDIHGVVPEEFHYTGDLINAKKYNDYEKLAIQYANYIIVVSDSMKEHLQKKYKPNEIKGQFITIPIISDQVLETTPPTEMFGYPIKIIYSGGLQKWQQVDKMIEIIELTYTSYQYKFYCPQPEIIVEKFQNNRSLVNSIDIGSKTGEELKTIYPECHYGFILREDILVNQVACSTKLIEYLSYGIVPIVDSENIGDFKRLGMQYVSIKDVIEKLLPYEDVRRQMVLNIFQVLEKIKSQYIAGINTLKSIVQ
jgi:hypothetical protein